MSIIKSFSVGVGDMYYIKHNTDNFTIIDCYLSEVNKKRIVDEIITESNGKQITRFISTHPDQDHLAGIEYLDSRNTIANFYCVENEATKPDKTASFDKYCELRDSVKAYNIFKGCTRKWMNITDVSRKHSGIQIIWPDTNNEYYKQELIKAKEGESPNNISAIIQYSVGGAVFLWMGDLETTMMENIKDELLLTKVNILFAPHHGRDSGKIPTDLLEKMNPDIIIIGEAPSAHLHYYPDYNTITQNTAEDIIFEVVENKIHIYTSNENHTVEFLDDENMTNHDYYIGTLNVGE
jgi:beta-lactamase superfamily II metal-dependent hydrolase